MIDTNFLHQLDHFSLIINKRITSNYVGERFSSATGRGLIFKDHVLYAPGEDFRTIDWKVYGRTDKLFVKRFEEERNLTVHVLVDFSASMNFGTHVKKSEFASMIAVGFAYLALKNNERFVVSLFSDEVEVVKPKRGMTQIAAVINYLDNKKPKGSNNIYSCLKEYSKAIKSKAYLVVISDFLYPVEDIEKALFFFKNHQVVLIQVLDKMESKLDIEGDFKLSDMESNSILHTFINAFTRRKYQNSLEEHNARIKHVCDLVGAQFYPAHTGQTPFDVFYDVLGRKR
ncbi:DUF58 domain-containing protein [Candidatus Woesearchaeota archaeon CG10_big_fil_rev_8_21_14_0_10_37_12]|nr:MAG: DUF58 domain-containing protein [Candidatus Woesearchaeota archaeon CG10_big_fil_rev_8_21_14_0_10_37_12]